VLIVVCVQEVLRSWTREVVPDRDFTMPGLQAILSPRDEHAIEEALRLQGMLGGEVTLLTAGRLEAEETAVRAGLAMGAHTGVLIVDPAFREASAEETAALLAQTLRTMHYDLILMGPGRLESSGGQTPVSVAALLDLPVLTSASSLRFYGSEVRIRRTRSDGDEEEAEARLPAVVSVAADINTPRVTTLKGVIDARRKRIAIVHPR
jgi:electron transfer flavoprotein beta subunit